MVGSANLKEQESQQIVVGNKEGCFGTFSPAFAPVTANARRAAPQRACSEPRKWRQRALLNQSICREAAFGPIPPRSSRNEPALPRCEADVRSPSSCSADHETAVHRDGWIGQSPSWLRRCRAKEPHSQSGPPPVPWHALLHGLRWSGLSGQILRVAARLV
jgi:hypothetical protein